MNVSHFICWAICQDSFDSFLLADGYKGKACVCVTQIKSEKNFSIFGFFGGILSGCWRDLNRKSSFCWSIRLNYKPQQINTLLRNSIWLKIKAANTSNWNIYLLKCNMSWSVSDNITINYFTFDRRSTVFSENSSLCVFLFLLLLFYYLMTF